MNIMIFKNFYFELNNFETAKLFTQKIVKIPETRKNKIIFLKYYYSYESFTKKCFSNQSVK